MELWLPSLLTGVFTLIAAFGGYTLSGSREKLHRAEDQDRVDKNSQRQAVAAFLRADRTLSGQFLAEVDGLGTKRSLGLLHPEQVAALTSMKGLYFNDLIQELEVLDLYLHDPHVRKSFNRVNDIIRKKHEKFLTELQRIDAVPPSQQDRIFGELVLDGIATQDLRQARNKLIETARNRLRLTNEYLGMYTPFED